MIPFLKNNNEKLTLIIVLILAIIIFFTSLAGATGDKTPDKNKKEVKTDIMAFNQAVKELEASLKAEEDHIYEIQQKVRFYDADFNLIYETTQQEVEEETDREALRLLGKSTLFMVQKEGDIYMLL